MGALNMDKATHKAVVDGSKEMANVDPSKAWFTFGLAYEEAKALRAQIGDVPKSYAGPRLLALYRALDAHLRLSGSVDDPPPQLPVVRGRGASAKKYLQKRPKPPKLQGAS